MLRVGTLLIAMVLLGTPGVLASGTVICAGVSNPGGHDLFTKVGWQGFWGVNGQKGEVWLENHTRVSVQVIVYGTDQFVENTVVSAGSTKTVYVPNDVEVVRVDCSYWNGPVAANPDPSLDPDFGGVSVDPAPTTSGTLPPGVGTSVLNLL